MKNPIENSVTVITGASSGIGRATALQLAAQKGSVVLAARRENLLQDLAEECEAKGGKALVVKTDVCSEEAVNTLANQALKAFGKIDYWVNNAAVALFGRIDETPTSVYKRVIDTNVLGYVYGAKAVIPLFKKQGHGTLINVSSVAGKVGQPFTSAYNTSKFAILGLSESLRMEMKENPGIHICAVLPASIDTPFFQNGANYLGRKAKPMKPVYTADSVARAILSCMTQPKAEVMVGNSGRGMLVLRRLAPRLAEAMIARKVNKDHFYPDRSEAPSEGNLFNPDINPGKISGGWNGHDTRWGILPLIGLAGLGIAAWMTTQQNSQKGTATQRPRARSAKAA